MGLREMIRAIREYPAVQNELKQAQQALKRSEQERRSLQLTLGEQKDYTKFLSRQSAALQAALVEFCPRLSSAEEMKKFYDTISPSVDPQGFTLYHMAERLTKIDVPSCFPYEDNRGLFTEMNGHQLLRWLTAAHFGAVEWTIVPGTTHESATLRDVDNASPEVQAFERQLYEKVLERMGFQDVIAPNMTRDERAAGLGSRRIRKERGDAR